MENEINSHDALTKAVISTGQKLVKGGHPASQGITEKVKELEIASESLKGKVQERRRRLVQSYENQHFLTEVRQGGKALFGFHMFEKKTTLFLKDGKY